MGHLPHETKVATGIALCISFMLFCKFRKTYSQGIWLSSQTVKYSFKQTKLVPSGIFLTRFPAQFQEITSPGLAPLAEYSCKSLWHSQKESMIRRVLKETHLAWLVIDAHNVSRVLTGRHVTWSVSFGLVSQFNLSDSMLGLVFLSWTYLIH